MALPNPVIVVPGITASELRDEYAVTPDTVWSAILQKRFDRIALHPDDVQYELLEPARVVADSVFGLTYGSLINELRHNLTEKRDAPVPVFPFAYDWRQPLDRIEVQLAAFIQEVIARTRLLRHYDAAGYDEAGKVDLVGHSMGGLIIAGYLQSHRKKARVGKVATLGTPFRGSLEAPIKVVTGTASLGEATQDSREREAARLTPALYHLVPSFEGALLVGEELPGDLYHAGTWQQGVIDTLAEFIRLHGLRKGGLTQRREWAESILAGMLSIAKAHRDRIEGFRLGAAGLSAADWLCLVGVDATTRVRLRIDRVRGKPLFDLRGEDRVNQWPSLGAGGEILTGDGTVPFHGAEPSFLERRHLVCLRPSDFGYWELQDRGVMKLAGFHAVLPNLNLVHRLLVSHLRGKPTKGVWGRPAPGIGRDEWQPPIERLPLKA